MSHCGGPPLFLGITEAGLGRTIAGIYANFWNGPAAVIVFFVISGFCIHYPFSASLQISSLAGYFTRRYLRIGVPLVGASAVSHLAGVKLGFLSDAILWSLAAELVYYSLYPFILALRRRGVLWQWMIVISFGASLLLAATNPTAKNYPSFGVSLNWLLGLPCWLTGCVLAEHVSLKNDRGSRAIWSIRILVWGTTVILSILRFHSPLGYPWTLNLFALMAAWWLAHEIKQFQVTAAPAFLEWAGRWSYSVYLLHLPAAAIFATYPLPNVGQPLTWALKMLWILVVSYLFYLCVEYPSHLAARAIGCGFRPQRNNEKFSSTDPLSS